MQKYNIFFIKNIKLRKSQGTLVFFRSWVKVAKGKWWFRRQNNKLIISPLKRVFPLEKCQIQSNYISLWAAENVVECFLTLTNGGHGGFICTFSLLISLSITLWSSKFRNQFTISSKYFDMVCYLKQGTYSGPISFEVQRNDIWTDNIQSFEMPF